MTHRELPKAEWDRLAPTELGACLWALPSGSRVLVVEDDDGVIVGTWAVIPYTHVEGVWIADAHRGRGRVAMHLLTGMRAIAQGVGVQVVLTAALTEEVQALILKCGGEELPGRHFAIPVGAD